jgi:pyruvate dehydrogenase kinase 2/3/4
MYSTAPKPGAADRTGQAPLAGYGYGLPLSRLYARYFQGDLVLNSVEGYGTSAVIFLKTHSTDANELLPIYNKTADKHYRMAAPNPDWSAPMPGTHRNHPNAPTKSINVGPGGIAKSFSVYSRKPK